MRELCSIHNLALGPNGKCVLCRRPKQPLFAVREETESLLSKVFTWFLGACLLMAAAMLFYSSKLDQGYSGGRYSGEALQSATPKSTASPAKTSAAQPKQAANGSSAKTVQVRPEAAKGTVTAAKPAPSGPPVAVTMYATPWCFICDRSRDFLAARNVTLTELDIERDRTAKAKLAKINPTLSLPTFELAGKTYVGFNPWQLEDAIRDASAQQLSRAP
ncbi:MAG: glutaredoxin domain-containing protein [Polyangiales bacterium]